MPQFSIYTLEGSIADNSNKSHTGHTSSPAWTVKYLTDEPTKFTIGDTDSICVNVRQLMVEHVTYEDGDTLTLATLPAGRQLSPESTLVCNGFIVSDIGRGQRPTWRHCYNPSWDVAEIAFRLLRQEDPTIERPGVSITTAFQSRDIPLAELMNRKWSGVPRANYFNRIGTVDTVDQNTEPVNWYLEMCGFQALGPDDRIINRNTHVRDFQIWLMQNEVERLRQFSHKLLTGNLPWFTHLYRHLDKLYDVIKELPNEPSGEQPDDA